MKSRPLIKRHENSKPLYKMIYEDDFGNCLTFCFFIKKNGQFFWHYPDSPKNLMSTTHTEQTLNARPQEFIKL